MCVYGEKLETYECYIYSKCRIHRRIFCVCVCLEPSSTDCLLQWKLPLLMNKSSRNCFFLVIHRERLSQLWTAPSNQQRNTKPNLNGWSMTNLGSLPHRISFSPQHISDRNKCMDGNYSPSLITIIIFVTSNFGLAGVFVGEVTKEFERFAISVCAVAMYTAALAIPHLTPCTTMKHSHKQIVHFGANFLFLVAVSNVDRNSFRYKDRSIDKQWIVWKRKE